MLKNWKHFVLILSAGSFILQVSLQSTPSASLFVSYRTRPRSRLLSGSSQTTTSSQRWDWWLTVSHIYAQIHPPNPFKVMPTKVIRKCFDEVLVLSTSISVGLGSLKVFQNGFCRATFHSDIIKMVLLCFSTASTKHLQYFSLDYRGEVQQLTFDQPQVHRLFYGSFHKVGNAEVFIWILDRHRVYLLHLNDLLHQPLLQVNHT